jgi:hypothetical protein
LGKAASEGVGPIFLVNAYDAAFGNPLVDAIIGADLRQVHMPACLPLDCRVFPGFCHYLALLGCTNLHVG